MVLAKEHLLVFPLFYKRGNKTILVLHELHNLGGHDFLCFVPMFDK